MLTYPTIDPVALQLGPVSVHWYGLMYLFGFLGGYALLMLRAKRADTLWSPEQVSDIVFYGAMGVIIGGRLGYVVFYNLDFYLQNPLDIFKLYQGGMSFHGGFIGVIVSMGLFCRNKAPLFDLLDFLAPTVPIGLLTGRIGNFINAELWGRVTDVPWAMVFPGAGALPRHPSQLYQAFLEGVVMLLVLWLFTMKPKPRYVASGLFCVLYGSFRFLMEFVREPDSHLQFVLFDWMTMGQVLSLPMVAAGAAMMIIGYQKAQYPQKRVS